jgi:hypothetical protein
MKLSISSLKRARNEKVQTLGSKVFDMMADGKKVDADQLKADYAAIIDLDEQIKLAAIELAKIQAEETVGAAVIPERVQAYADKTKTSKRRKSANSDVPARAQAYEGETTKKAGRPAKATAAKKPAAKKTAKPAATRKNTPAVATARTLDTKDENKPVVKDENIPAVVQTENTEDKA